MIESLFASKNAEDVRSTSQNRDCLSGLNSTKTYSIEQALTYGFDIKDTLSGAASQPGSTAIGEAMTGYTTRGPFSKVVPTQAVSEIDDGTQSSVSIDPKEITK